MKYLIIIAVLLTTGSCKKDENKKGKVTFYQTGFTNFTPELYLDGKKIGNLTISVDDNVPCGFSANEQIRTIELGYGEHEYYLSNYDSSHVKFTVYSDCRVIKVQPR